MISATTSSLRHLAEYMRYGLLFGVNKLARRCQSHPNAHVGAVKHGPRLVAGTINFEITYTKGSVYLTNRVFGFSLGNSPDNCTSMSPHIDHDSGSSRNHGPVSHGGGNCRSGAGDQTGSLLCNDDRRAPVRRCDQVLLAPHRQRFSSACEGELHLEIE